MGIRVNGPQVVAFLEWMRRNYPDARSFKELPSEVIWKLAREFRLSLPREVEGSGADFSDHDLPYVIDHKPGGIWGQSRSRPQQLYEGDLLENYLAVPYRSIVLFTGHDVEARNYLENHWDSWNEESGKLLNFYDYSIRVGSPKAYSFSKAFLRSLDCIPGADVDRIRAIGLPCMLIWSDDDHALVPFGDVAHDPSQIRDRFRRILQLLGEGKLHDLRARFDIAIERAERERADVFISYRHTDREWVARFHDALERDGFDTWYDDHLRAGDRFDLRIQRVLETAPTTIVVWSPNSIRSEWVRSEAMYAYALRRLAPISLDMTVVLPPPFGSLHTENLERWPDEPGRVGYDRLLSSINNSRPNVAI